MANRYFVNGGVDNNWSTSGNWSLTPGGSGGQPVPTWEDDVFLNGSSPNCNVNVEARCASITCTGYTQTLTLQDVLYIYGNCTMVVGMSFVSDGFYVYIAGTCLLISAGKTFSNIELYGGALTLGDNLDVNGTLDYNTNYLFLNGKTLNLAGDLMGEYGFIDHIIPGNGKIVFDGYSNIHLYVQTLYDVTIAPGATVVIMNSGVWNNITISGEFNAVGNSGSRITLRTQDGTSSRVHWKCTGTINVDYVDATDIDSSGGYLVYDPNGVITDSPFWRNTLPTTIHITTPTELQNMNLDLTSDYILDNDLDMAGIVWVPIGNWDESFMGTFDGNNHVISNMTVDDVGDQWDYSAMFGTAGSEVQAAVIQNLTLTNSHIGGVWAAGALVGYADCVIISNVHVVDCVVEPATEADDSDTFGGLCGGIYGGDIFCSIRDCTVTGSITAETNVGGLIGGNWGWYEFDNCHVDVNILPTTIGSNWASGEFGGFAGYFYGSANKCSAKVTMDTGPYNGTDVGGFVGLADSSIFTNCYAEGSIVNINSTGGGFSGYEGGDSTYTNCYANVNISGGITIGGFIGDLSDSSFTNCYSVGTVTANAYPGGFASILDVRYLPTLTNCSWYTGATDAAFSDGGSIAMAPEECHLDKTRGYIYAVSSGGGSAPDYNRVARFRESDLGFVDMLTLNTDTSWGDLVSVIDEANGFLYVGSSIRFGPAKIAKINLSTFTQVDTLTVNAIDWFGAAAIDATNGFAYFSSFADPCVVVKVKLSNFTLDGTISLIFHQAYGTTMSIDVPHQFLYVGAGYSSFYIAKINLSTFLQVDSLLIPSSGDFVAQHIDEGNHFLYLIASTRINKINLNTFTITSFISTSFASRIYDYDTNTILDDVNGFIYLIQYDTNYEYYVTTYFRINLSSFTMDASQPFAPWFWKPRTSTIDISGDCAYYASGDMLFKTKLSDMSMTTFSYIDASVPLLATGGQGTDEPDNTQFYHKEHQVYQNSE